MSLTLHGYWRSSATYRVRIALALKGLAYEQAPHDLRRGDQRDAAYLALNPQGFVPALETEGQVLTQSLAIIEWLEERYPAPPLLPETAEARVKMRAMVGMVACDIHPLNNLRVLQRLRRKLGVDQEAVTEWAAHWIAEGFTALEAMIIAQGGTFSYGDSPGMADCFLVPQVYSAERFGVDLSPFPAIRRVNAHCLALDAFRAAHPSAQPDAD